MNKCGMRSSHLPANVSLSPEHVCPSLVQTNGVISAECPAKLNVFLEVLGKRTDGYHELETVMLRTRFADHLSVRATTASVLTLRFSDATPESLRTGVPLDTSNLILRAADRLRDLLGISGGAEFILHKRIPPESGLGGGSSNAATALTLCRQLWNPDLPDAALHTIAASLGSDINFLLSGFPAAVCRGRGEILEPFRLDSVFRFVALRPARGNSTAEVFRQTSFASSPVNSSSIVRRLTGESSGDLSTTIFNRLTAAAIAVNPAMAELMLSVKRQTNRPVFMSGSGSTLFVTADSHSHARKLQSILIKATRRPVWLLETIAH